MLELERYTEQVGRGAHLTAEEIAVLVGELTREDVGAERKAAFLTALARRGETAEEIAAFARELRERSLRPVVPPSVRDGMVLDVVGTGGDRLNTFNISTTAALAASAAGMVVAKHGNRAVTSKSGSADVLEALGVRVELTPEEVGNWLARYRFAFLLAPRFHPAFRHIGPARRLCAEAGQRTLFNFLGPLLNPVVPGAQLMGVARTELCEPMAHVLRSLGVRRGMVVCGSVPVEQGGTGEAGGFIDEISTLGPTVVSEFYQERALSTSTMEPGLFPLQPARLEALRGGDREFNAELSRRILEGTERGPCRDSVRLNAGAALFVGGAVASLIEGWERIGEVIDSGAAAAHLAALVEASR
jgi:anthranilate phosphoribosyltransferase